MIAFLSRFWLDAQNTDLSEEIEQKKEEIEIDIIEEEEEEGCGKVG